MKLTPKIKAMQEGGRRLAQIREQRLKEAKVGIRTLDLDQLAEKLILTAGGKPSFKMVPGYSWSTCLCVNDCIVHGVPGEYRLRQGDLLTIDIGMFFAGYHTDTAVTIIVGQAEPNLFLQYGQRALTYAIAQAQPGKHIGHISQAIEETIQEGGFNVVRTLVGHGIGRKLHQDPQIPCFLEEKIEDTPKLKAGMTLAVEVIYTRGKPSLQLDRKDGWTIRTKDGSDSAMFEHTIAVTKSGPLILTQSPL